ncbi:MAG: hypothetical protein FWD32_01840, partial [Firmicutes bacterium]|nr:hypothetical protein [Bacillota bacterium]
MGRNYNNIIISSRVRLARNIEGMPFKNTSQNTKLVANIGTTIKNNYTDFDIVLMKNLPETIAQTLYEKHLISHELLENRESGAIAVNQNRTISIMLNEEDQIRIQAILPKANLLGCYKLAKDIDDTICKFNKVAFDYELGFLTSCPTNLGTGMRASIMLFLPALEQLNMIDKIADQLRDVHMTIRGIYGEGSQGIGCMYQISNQASLGQTEDALICSVSDKVLEICDLELDMQQKIMANDKNQTINKIYRAWGLLTNSYMLTTNEAVENAALIKFGAILNILKFEKPEIIDSIFTRVQPSIMMQQDNSAIAADKRDKLRAS